MVVLLLDPVAVAVLLVLALPVLLPDLVQVVGPLALVVRPVLLLVRQAGVVLPLL